MSLEQGRKYQRIGDVAKALSLKTCVLRFWEDEFSQLRPHRTPKGQRLYSAKDIELLKRIQTLLHEQGMTIDGARRVLAGKMSEPGAVPVANSGIAVPDSSNSSDSSNLSDLPEKVLAPSADANALSAHKAEAEASQRRASAYARVLQEAAAELRELRELLKAPDGTGSSSVNSAHSAPPASSVASTHAPNHGQTPEHKLSSAAGLAGLTLWDR